MTGQGRTSARGLGLPGRGRGRALAVQGRGRGVAGGPGAGASNWSRGGAVPRSRARGRGIGGGARGQGTRRRAVPQPQRHESDNEQDDDDVDLDELVQYLEDMERIDNCEEELEEDYIDAPGLVGDSQHQASITWREIGYECKPDNLISADFAEGWRSDFPDPGPPISLPFDEDSVGLQVPCPDRHEPLGYFELMVRPSMLQRIADETNAYTRRLIATHTRGESFRIYST